VNVHGQPLRTFYIAITHDEEVGRSGARGVADYLSQQPFGQHEQFEFVLDEGTIILEEALPSLETPVAIVSVAEKGYMSVEYRVNISPGHSSMPTTPSAIGILARAIERLESTPKPSRFGRGPELALLQGLTPYLKFPLRLVMSNIWLFKPIIQWVLARQPGTNALQRTTTAITLIQGGEKENILPTSASAIINRKKSIDKE
jgi:carboxypeptidase PM20D1